MDENFQIFLNGSHRGKATNFSFVKYLPPEIINQIWLEYAYNLDNAEIVNFGLLSVLKKKYANGQVRKDEFLVYAAVRCQNLEIIKWLVLNEFILVIPNDEENIFNNDLSLLNSIIGTRNLEIIEFFFRTCPMIFKEGLEDPLIIAASVNDLGIVMWIYENDLTGFYRNVPELSLLDTTLVDTSIRNNNIDMLLWVLSVFENAQCTKYALVYAAQTRNVDMFDIVYKVFFVQKKRFEIAQYLHLCCVGKNALSQEIRDYISTSHLTSFIFWEKLL